MFASILCYDSSHGEIFNRNAPPIMLKPLPIILVIAIFGTIFGVYLIRGFGPEGEGALFSEQRIRLAESYFRTPEAAVKVIDRLVLDNEWIKLGQYYDLESLGITEDVMTDGSFFGFETLENGSSEGTLATSPHIPFKPGYRFLQVRKLDAADIYKVTVVLDPSPGDDHEERDLASFHLKRFPEGYRLVSPPPSPPID